MTDGSFKYSSASWENWRHISSVALLFLVFFLAASRLCIFLYRRSECKPGKIATQPIIHILAKNRTEVISLNKNSRRKIRRESLSNLLQADRAEAKSYFSHIKSSHDYMYHSSNKTNIVDYGTSKVCSWDQVAELYGLSSISKGPILSPTWP